MFCLGFYCAERMPQGNDDHISVAIKPPCYLNPCLKLVVIIEHLYMLFIYLTTYTERQIFTKQDISPKIWGGMDLRQ